eukprot:Clim_evm70s215 gene=Clim_evmTU70s215
MPGRATNGQQARAQGAPQPNQQPKGEDVHRALLKRGYLVLPISLCIAVVAALVGIGGMYFDQVHTVRELQESLGEQGASPSDPQSAKADEEKELMSRKLEFLKDQLEETRARVAKCFEDYATSHKFSLPDGPTLTEVDRRSDLTFEEFFHEYERKSKPVIITDYAGKVFPGGLWSIERIREACGDQEFTAKRKNLRSTEWALLEDVGEKNVGEFIDYYQEQKQSRADENPLYLFDWPLHNCDETLLRPDSFIMPKYFAGDFLRRQPRLRKGTRAHKVLDGVKLDIAFPTLFMSNDGTSSGMHIDGYGSSFWMILLEGEKHWVFFDPADIPLLYENRETFVMDVDVRPVTKYGRVPNGENKAEAAKTLLEEKPLVRFAHGFEVVLKPGELLFVPAGTPHQVSNVGDAVAVCGNYVDEANLDYALSATSSEWYRNDYLYHWMMTVPRGNPKTQQDMTYLDYRKGVDIMSYTRDQILYGDTEKRRI